MLQWLSLFTFHAVANAAGGAICEMLFRAASALGCSDVCICPMELMHNWEPQYKQKEDAPRNWRLTGVHQPAHSKTVSESTMAGSTTRCRCGSARKAEPVLEGWLPSARPIHAPKSHWQTRSLSSACNRQDWSQRPILAAFSSGRALEIAEGLLHKRGEPNSGSSQGRGTGMGHGTRSPSALLWPCWLSRWHPPRGLGLSWRAPRCRCQASLLGQRWESHAGLSLEFQVGTFLTQAKNKCEWGSILWICWAANYILKLKFETRFANWESIMANP